MTKPIQAIDENRLTSLIRFATKYTKYPTHPNKLIKEVFERGSRAHLACDTAAQGPNAAKMQLPRPLSYTY